ncbi:unnamed protein product, partial [Heterosigma akashiwo]
KLYVGNLSFKTTDKTLKQAFGKCGKVVSAMIMTDRNTGQSRGFGFVTYDKKEDALAATKEFDGKEFDSRTLKVNIAQPKGEAPPANRAG